jgi:hypothetical protein
VAACFGSLIADKALCLLEHAACLKRFSKAFTFAIIFCRLSFTLPFGGIAVGIACKLAAKAAMFIGKRACKRNLKECLGGKVAAFGLALGGCVTLPY